MIFCPNCANLLLIKTDSLARNQFYCQTCPYIYTITRSFSTRLDFNRKQVDDVLGGADAWKNVDSTDASCPKCEHGRAYFMQIQIRSADEPMSIFYKCCSCGHQWREGYLINNKFITNIVNQHQKVTEKGLPYPPDQRGLFSGCIGDKKASLTFDDSPHNLRIYTPLILDALRDLNVSATFMVLGINSVKYPDVVTWILKEGHEIASHSWGHQNYVGLPSDEIKSDIYKTEKAIEAITGYKTKFFRFPYGSYNGTVVDILYDIGYFMILWNVDSGDWKFKNPQSITEYTLKRISQIGKASPLILMHDIHNETIATLPVLISRLRKEGYELVSLEDCLGLTSEMKYAHNSEESNKGMKIMFPNLMNYFLALIAIVIIIYQ
ncbi:glycoside hydrolase/deacetylase [Rozella allomycis CSF55]|uniref:DNA-directed RNA polymerase III subunit RPC10 n=1 Tax=Rozella allomycis (strain CSF55) TaxID=988480 RepID=A0A4P9YH65_ROZAC|nr:glycoside hydrolase/deacetylase [Rozella allomycis CSF55]